MKKLIFVLSTFFASLVSYIAFAETVASGAAPTATGGFNSYAIGPAIIMAAASGLGTLAQSRAAAAALDGIARNPQAAEKVQTPLILSLALMESLVIFAFVIAIILVFK